ncbi:MAG: methyltransferase domain-containing protein [Rubrobacteraceae bacterium]
MDRTATGLRVCDLACGQGIAARQLAKQGARVVGVDIYPPAYQAVCRPAAGFLARIDQPIGHH